MSSITPNPLFVNLSAEVGDCEPVDIESICMNCHENGSTRILLTSIPFYKEVVLMSFSCPHCGHSNNELKPAGRIHDRGCLFRLWVVTSEDLNRQIVRTDSATVRIPSLEFEIPPGSTNTITTVEGLIDRVVDSLTQDQSFRETEDPEKHQSIDQFIKKLLELKSLKSPFWLEIDDPSGNSFVENPLAPAKDVNLIETRYDRSFDQCKLLGMYPSDAVEENHNTDNHGGTASAENHGGSSSGTTGNHGGSESGTSGNHGGSESGTPGNHGGSDYGATESDFVSQDVFSFDTGCPSCGSESAATRMRPVRIPHFKEVIVMATSCESCGYRSNEVKSGSGVEPLGQRIELRMSDSRADLCRDVLKSETSSLEIPELELAMEHGTLGGRFTTVEGLLRNVRDQLTASNPFLAGDSLSSRLGEFLGKIDDIIAGSRLVTIVIDDPAGNSYVESLSDNDPNLVVTRYERSYEDNEELGLNDMKTENYE